MLGAVRGQVITQLWCCSAQGLLPCLRDFEVSRDNSVLWNPPAPLSFLRSGAAYCYSAKISFIVSTLVQTEWSKLPHSSPKGWTRVKFWPKHGEKKAVLWLQLGQEMILHLLCGQDANPYSHNTTEVALNFVKDRMPSIPIYFRAILHQGSFSALVQDPRDTAHHQHSDCDICKLKFLNFKIVRRANVSQHTGQSRSWNTSCCCFYSLGRKEKQK